MCGTFDETTGRYDIEHSSATLASGTHDLSASRCQVVFNGLYNHFRREENLVSYKLDYVAGPLLVTLLVILNIPKKKQRL